LEVALFMSKYVFLFFLNFNNNFNINYFKLKIITYICAKSHYIYTQYKYNMLKINLFIFISLISFGFHAQENAAEITHRTIEIKQVDIIAENFVADIDLGSEFKVISATSTKRHKDLKLAKDEAYFNAIVDNQIDVLVDPIYSIKKRGKFLFFFGGYVEAKVVGYAGYYKNVLPESHARAIMFDNNLNELIDFIASNKSQGLQKVDDTDTFLNEMNSKENQKVTDLEIKQQSVIDLYEKANFKK